MLTHRDHTDFMELHNGVVVCSFPVCTVREPSLMVQDIEMMGEFGYLIQSKAAVCFLRTGA